MTYTDFLNQFTVDAMVVSRSLMAFYARLGDAKQRLRAELVERFAEEHVRRKVQQASRVLIQADSDFRSRTGSLPEVDFEQTAWSTLAEALIGLAFFHRFGARKDPALQRLADRGQRALEACLSGFQTAFPEEHVRAGVEEAFLRAQGRCVAAIYEDLTTYEKVDPEVMEIAVREVLGDLHTDLGAWVDHWLANLV